MEGRILINGKSPLAIMINNRPVLYVMVNSQRVWPIIPDDPDNPEVEVLSCFGMGYWLDDQPWTDDIGWTD